MGELLKLLHSLTTVENAAKIERISDLVADYDYVYQAERLLHEYKKGLMGERLEEMIADLEQSVYRHYRPHPKQKHSAKQDYVTFFRYLRANVEEERPETVEFLLDRVFPYLFDGFGKSVCGAERSRCNSPSRRKPCNHQYQRGDESLFCAVCDEPRLLCLKPPKRNGRCTHHGGTALNNMALTKSFKGRSPYLSYMGKRQQELAQNLLDEDYLTLIHEMGLLRVGIMEIVEEMDEVDPVLIAREMSETLKRQRQALADGDLGSVRAHNARLSELMSRTGDNAKRWERIQQLTSQVGNLADKERKRIVDAQEMITRHEMDMLLTQTLKDIGRTLKKAAQKTATELRRTLKDQAEPEMWELFDGKFSRKHVASMLAHNLRQQFADGLYSHQDDDPTLIGARLIINDPE